MIGAEIGIKVHGCSGPLGASQGFQSHGLLCILERTQNAPQSLLTIKHGFAQVWPLARQICQGGVLSFDFGCHDGMRQLLANLRLAQRQDLMPTALGVVVGRPCGLGQLLPTPPANGQQMHAVLCQGAQHLAAELGVGTQDHAVQKFQGQAPSGLVVRRADVQDTLRNLQCAALTVDVKRGHGLRRCGKNDLHAPVAHGPTACFGPKHPSGSPPRGPCLGLCASATAPTNPATQPQ
mgnify:CR=1 FL=1